MVGCEKEGGRGGLNRESLNALNLIFPEGRFCQIQSDIHTHARTHKNPYPSS